MHLHTRNVNTAFRRMVDIVGSWPNNGMDCVRRTNSRNGAVLVIDEPVTVTYTHPTERVLFNSVRDANPFFHVYEALWMLAGRDNVAPLARYVKRMEDFSDDGETLNGAYGYRWRHAPREQHNEFYVNDVDQLDVIVAHLKATPDSRRAVLQMWNVEDDLLKIGTSKDVCCNLSVMFSLRPFTDIFGHKDAVQTGSRDGHSLDMTVTNRSNDMVWGMLGANYVHFSFLQEYMAARLRAKVGRYHHFTNNLHVYSERPDWRPREWLYAEQGGPDYALETAPAPMMWQHVPLVHDAGQFDKELPAFVEAYSKPSVGEQLFTEPFLTDVAQPMMRAHSAYKDKDKETALRIAGSIVADDWHIACTRWLERRMK